MAQIATLLLEDQEMRILKCNYEFNQDVDSQARPMSVVRGGIIQLMVESSENESCHIWSAAYNMKKDGQIIFKRKETASPLRKITFRNAHCIHFREDYDIYREMTTVSFTLAAEELQLNQASFKNQW